MITKFDVTNDQGNLRTFVLEDASSGVLTKDISGVGPIKATIVSSNYAKKDGAYYQNSRRESRNILIKFKLQPDYISTSVEDLRTGLYEFFMPQSPVSLRFYTSGGLTVDISGRVEDFDTPFFTKEPEAAISIICFDPDFIGISPVNLTGNTVSTLAETIVDYEGSTKTGFVFTLNVDRPLSSFAIYNRPADNIVRTFDFSAALLAGDVVTISTVSGSKSVTRTRSGVSTPILYAMSPQSNWIEFARGINNFRVFASGAAVPYQVTYTPLYGGL